MLSRSEINKKIENHYLKVFLDRSDKKDSDKALNDLLYQIKIQVPENRDNKSGYGK